MMGVLEQGRAQEGSETEGFIGISHETGISSLKMLESLRFQWQKWGCFGAPVAGDGKRFLVDAAKPFLCQEWCSPTAGLSLLTLQVLELKMGPGHLDCLRTG